MDDLNACAQCGFTTQNFAEFAIHVEAHEVENQRGQQDHVWNDNEDEDQLIAADSSRSSSKSPKPSPKAVHTCPHCNFTTYMSQHMKSHLEAHERHQGQMYQCDLCQMQFSQKANMHRHRMRHSGVKPYQCRFCLKRFFRKDQMQEHSMTHIKTGADFDCPVKYCEMQFGQHSALRAHLDDYHMISPSSPANCKRCLLLFANSRRLLLHYQTKHDDVQQELAKSGNFNTPKSAINTRRRKSQQQQLLNQQQQSISMVMGGGTIKRETDECSPPIVDVVPPSAPPKSITPDDQHPIINTNQSSSFAIRNAVDDISKSVAFMIRSEFREPPSSWSAGTNGNNSNGVGSDEVSHSPSIDSGGSSSAEGENGGTGTKEHKDCLYCGLIFLDQTLYLLHKGLHSDSDPWKCNLCGHECHDKYRFHTHIISADHS